MLPLALKGLLGVGKIAAPLVKETAVLGGLTAGAGALLNQVVPGGREFTGMTLDEIAKGEGYDLDNPESYRNDIGDRLRSIVSGYSVDEVEKRARELAIKNVNDSLKADREYIAKTAADLGLATPDLSQFKYQDGQSTKTAARNTARELERLSTIEQLRESGIPLDVISGTKSAAGATGAAVKYREDQKKTREKEERERIQKETERLELRKDQRRLEDLQIMREKMIDARSQADRNFNLQLQQMTNQNRRLDREDARSARKDQQALYAMLLQGLSNLNF